MKYPIAIFFLIFSIPSLAYKYYAPDHPVHVEGYTRSDGTYVEPYYRARPGEARESDSLNSGYNSNTYSNNYNNDSGYNNYDSSDSNDNDDDPND